MTNKQIKKIEQILTGYKYDPKMSDGYYYIFKDSSLEQRVPCIAFEPMCQRWWSYSITQSNQEVTRPSTAQETYYVYLVITKVLGW